MKELSDAQVHQIDILHNAIYNAMVEATRNISDKRPEWDMEWIGECADAFADIAERYFKIPEKLMYPYIDEDKEE